MPCRCRRRSIVEAGDDDQLRWGLVKKVYMIVLVQLIVTMILVYIVTGVAVLRNFHYDHAIFALVALVIFLVVGLCFALIFMLRHTVPLNYICLGVYTVAFTYFLLMRACRETRLDKILIGTALTIILFALIVLFIMYVGWDTTACNLILIDVITLVVLCVLMLLNYILSYFMGPRIEIPLVVACIGMIIFGFDLLYCNQLILAKNCQYVIKIEEYLLAALHAYTDIVLITVFTTLFADYAALI